MQLLSEQLSSLESLDVPQTRRPDFDRFWASAVEKCKSADLSLESKTVDSPLGSVEVRDISYSGLDGTRVQAWLLLPPEAKNGAVPALVHYHGYTGNRGYPSDFAPWLLMGCAVLSMDFRMQSGYTGSNTGFAASAQINPFVMNLLDRDNFYFYHVWTDALRLIEAALQTPQIDKSRICVEGGSQGGATSLAMASLSRDVALCMADVPSNCWFEKRIFDRSGSGSTLADFLRRHPDKVQEVSATLSYFDNLNLASGITCPTLISCGLKDPVCPPHNVYAAYNKIAAPKEIRSYPFGEHDGGGAFHMQVKMEFLKKSFSC